MRGKRELAPPPGVWLRLIPACAGKTSTAQAPVFDGGAHPRVCGENIYPSLKTYTARGSSPRVRGKRQSIPAQSLAPRLIPACAGKTRTSQVVTQVYGAHPRVCGENCSIIRASVAAWGSSPRVRGKPRAAGPEAWPGLAHPRVCGENMISTKGTAKSEGSSPRVRGKQP